LSMTGVSTLPPLAASLTYCAWAQVNPPSLERAITTSLASADFDDPTIEYIIVRPFRLNEGLVAGAIEGSPRQPTKPLPLVGELPGSPHAVADEIELAVQDVPVASEE